MPRPPRLLGAGATYHITARGNNGEVIFTDDLDRYRYLTRLAEARRAYEFRLFAYVLMSNHVHLVVQASQPNVSSAIQSIHGRHATEFNRKLGRHGHLFGGRFKARAVEGNEDLLQVTSYIHLNPVRAGLVVEPEDYSWSSFRLYLEPATADSLVDQAPVLGILSVDVDRARLAYVEFIRRAATVEKAGGILVHCANQRDDVLHRGVRPS